MAKPELGTKRTCQNCGTKFFDLGREPITCPKCGATFQATALSSRVSRAAAVRDDDEAEAETGAEVVALEDADAIDDGKVAPVAVEDDADIIEDDAASDDEDTFLQEEEEDDADVADLIDGEIEDDEER